MERIRWGVVGAGDVIGRKSGPALLAAARSEIAAVCPRDLLDCGARVHANVNDMVAAGGIDAVYVATPPDRHEGPVLAALRSGLPVLVEKPLAPDVATGARMIAAAEAAGLTLSVAYYRRFSPRLMRLAAMVEAGAVGDVEAVEIAQRRTDGAPKSGWRADPAVSPGGRFSDSHAHALDWLIHQFGPLRRTAGAPGGDGSVAYALRLAQAPVAGVFDPKASEAEDRLTILGADGTLSSPFFDEGLITLERDGGRLEIECEAPAQGHAPLFAAMEAHLLDGAPPPCPARDCAEADKVIAALFRRGGGPGRGM